MTDPLDRLSQIQQEEAEHALNDPNIKERLMVSTLIELRDKCTIHDKKIKRLERLAVFFTGVLIALGATFPWILDLLRK